jgi:hypothetical protein
LQGLYAGRRCIIFGGGPSLLKTDITRLRDEVTIGSNAIFLIFDQMRYQPTFLTVEDPLVAEDRAAQLNQVRGSRKVFPHDLRRFLRLDADTTYCNFHRQYEGFPKFSAAFERDVFWGGTVSFMNLQLAYHVGCNPIYLTGFDHNYKVPDKMDGVVITSTTDDVNHFHPDYFGKGFRWHDPVVERMEQGYQAAKEFLDAHGVKVFNATAGGRLEVFPRVAFDEVFPPSG